MKKRYKLSYEWSAEMVVEIDDEKFTPEILKDWNEFWSDHEYRSAGKFGPLQPLLKMLYLAVIYEDLQSGRGARSFREGREEGYPNMDGSQGIEIVRFESFEFDDSCVEIVEETA
jgi:hypothetical protein